MRAPGVAAVGVALCVVAGAFAIRALYVPGVALVLLAATAELCVRLGAWRMRIEREPHAASVEERDALRMTLRVSARMFPLGGAELSRWPGDGATPLRRLSDEAISFAVRPGRRGRHVIGRSVLRLRDPFGMSSRSLSSSVCEVLVLPRIEPVQLEQLARVAGLAHELLPVGAGAPGGDVDGLRPYRPGAPASLIHWPTVARTGALIERALRSAGESLPLVVLDARQPVSEAALDMAIRAAASLCVALARLGGCSLLIPASHRAERIGSDLRFWPALHEQLALVRPGAAAGRAPLEQGATVICATAAARARIGDAGGAQADYTVSPIVQPHSPVLFSIAGCAVQPARRATLAGAA